MGASPQAETRTLPRAAFAGGDAMRLLQRLALGDRAFALLALALAAAVLVATSSVVVRYTDALLRAETERAAVGWAEHLGAAAPDLPARGAALDPLEAVVASGNAVGARLFSPDGAVIRAVGEGATAGPPSAEALAAALAGEVVTSRRGGADGPRRLDALVPVRAADGSVAGAVEVALDDGPSRDRLRRGMLVLLPTLLLIIGAGSAIPLLALVARTKGKRQAERRLQHLARHDSLTDLPNRDALRETLDAEIAAHAGQGRQLALHLVDLDGFRAINDAFGHAAGDAVLREVAARLGKLVADPRHLARLGSDEFAVLQPEAGGARHAEIYANRIGAALSGPVQAEGQDVPVSASLGVAIAPDHGTTARRVLTAAEIALRAAKAAGRNDVRLFRPDMERQTAGRAELRGELREAFERRWFEIAYQPQYDLRSGGLIGFEALMRLRHPRRGMISPAEFLPAAEEIGLVLPLNDWLLREACRAARDWPDGIGVTVNLSASQFRRNDGGQRILDLLTEAYCPPGRLGLDLTEEMLDAVGERLVEHLRRLKEAGVVLILDDFGAGPTCLANLRKYAFDAIKIDGDAVRAIGTDPAADAYARTLIGVGRGMGLVMIAECVETVEQAGFLVAHGCHNVQGFLFGAAVPVGEVPAIIARDQERLRAA